MNIGEEESNNDSTFVERQLDMINKNNSVNKSNSLKPLSQPTNFNYSGV